jgi:CBS domain containing-hemolysin-like protein
MTGTEILLLVGVLGSILVAVFFALAETSLTHVGRVKAIQLAEEKARGAQHLIRLIEDPARFLNVVLLLMMMLQVAGASMATLLAESLADGAGWATLIATFSMTIMSFVFAEAAPKTYAVQHSQRVALRVAPIVSWLIRLPGLQGVTKALVKVSNIVTPGRGLPKGPFVTEEEIRTMAAVAADEASIEEEEKEMIHSIFEFGDTVVREVMVPRPDMVGVSVGDDLGDVLTLMLEHGFSRMPVYKTGNQDNVAGLVYAKDVMRKLHGGRNGKRDAKPKLKDLIRKAMFVPDSKKVAELLREMQAKKTHMAIVFDEYGDTAGLVTMEDLLEEIVGEIADEYDREEPQVQPLGDNTLLVNGRLPIDELSELLDVELPDAEWDTVGGLMTGLLGKLPSKGEQVSFQGLRFRAERVQGRRIAKVLITKTPDAAASEGDGTA